LILTEGIPCIYRIIKLTEVIKLGLAFLALGYTLCLTPNDIIKILQYGFIISFALIFNFALDRGLCAFNITGYTRNLLLILPTVILAIFNTIYCFISTLRILNSNNIANIAIFF